jgi:hypothetical protein
MAFVFPRPARGGRHNGAPTVTVGPVVQVQVVPASATTAGTAPTQLEAQPAGDPEASSESDAEPTPPGPSAPSATSGSPAPSPCPADGPPPPSTGTGNGAPPPAATTTTTTRPGSSPGIQSVATTALCRAVASDLGCPATTQVSLVVSGQWVFENVLSGGITIPHVRLPNLNRASGSQPEGASASAEPQPGLALQDAL